MAEGKSGRELTPREPADVEAADASLTPTEGERRDVERFSAGPRAHSVGLTEERSAQIVRQSANARNVVFLAILVIALFIPVYWFYESGIPALGAEGRLAAEAETQFVTDVGRGYELYIANCAECHGETGRGDGFAADQFPVRPTDFTGERPTLAESLRVLGNGVEGTSMAPWTDRLTAAERLAVAHYVREFFP